MIRPSGMVVAVMHVKRLKSPNIPGPLKKSAPVNAREMCIFYVIESREVLLTNGNNDANVEAMSTIFVSRL